MASRILAAVVGSLLVMGACGGSTSDDKGGAGGSGGSGGSGACAGYGNFECEDCVGFYPPKCVSGTWSCVPSPQCSDGGGGCAAGGGGDCVDNCTGQFYLPDCVNGNWVCTGSTPCPDAGACSSNEVPTVDGCLSCSDATTAYTTAIEAARKANAGCSSATECVLTSAGTTCAGSCQVAVSQSGESAFAAALAQIDSDYCSGFVDVCGFSTPKCAVPSVVCTLGTCEVVFN